jgi:hypothetical protein
MEQVVKGVQSLWLVFERNQISHVCDSGPLQSVLLNGSNS